MSALLEHPLEVLGGVWRLHQIRQRVPFPLQIVAVREDQDDVASDAVVEQGLHACVGLVVFRSEPLHSDDVKHGVRTRMHAGHGLYDVGADLLESLVSVEQPWRVHDLWEHTNTKLVQSIRCDVGTSNLFG